MIYRVKFIIDFNKNPIKDIGIVIENGLIKDTGGFNNIFRKYPDKKTEDFGNYIAIPPIVNAHTHLELTNLDKKNLDFSSHINWVLSLIKEKRSKDNVFFKNALKTGKEKLYKYFTFYYGNIVSPFFYALNEFNFAEIICYKEEDISLKFEEIKNFQKLSPHTFFTVHPLLMEKIFSLHKPLSIHLFESKYEIEYLYENSGDIINKLYRFTGLKPLKNKPDTEKFILHLINKYHLKVNFVHLCYLTSFFENFLKKFKDKIIPILCPRSNVKLKNRLNFDFFIQNKIPFALGTDSIASNDDLNVVNEALFILENYQKDISECLFKALTVNGVKSLFLSDKYHAFKKNSYANFILLKYPENEINYEFILKNFNYLEKIPVMYKMF